VVLTDVYNTGDLNFEGALPIEGATADIHGVAVAYVRSLGVFGRSANVVLPYGNGNYDAIALGSPESRRGFTGAVLIAGGDRIVLDRVYGIPPVARGRSGGWRSGSPTIPSSSRRPRP